MSPLVLGALLASGGTLVFTVGYIVGLLDATKPRPLRFVRRRR